MVLNVFSQDFIEEAVSLSKTFLDNSKAIESFLEIEDYKNVELANNFFIEYGDGLIEYRLQNGESFPYYPYLSFIKYQKLLYELSQKNPIAYKHIHKGIPFYFLGYLSLILNNYDFAISYFNQAIREDKKNAKSSYKEMPAFKFLTLDSDFKIIGRGIVGEEKMLEIRTMLLKSIGQFNKKNATGSEIEWNNFITHFVKNLLTSQFDLLEPKQNLVNLVSAFYIFNLRNVQISKEIIINSEGFGITTRILSQLFLGANIYESILRIFYGDFIADRHITLGNIYNTEQFKNDFFQIDKISCNQFLEILEGIKDLSIESCFRTISKIRNTTGHSLIWEDIFTEENYRILFEQELYAIFYLIKSKYLPKKSI